LGGNLSAQYREGWERVFTSGSVKQKILASRQDFVQTRGQVVGLLGLVHHSCLWREGGSLQRGIHPRLTAALCRKGRGRRAIKKSRRKVAVRTDTEIGAKREQLIGVSRLPERSRVVKPRGHRNSEPLLRWGFLGLVGGTARKKGFRGTPRKGSRGTTKTRRLGGGRKPSPQDSSQAVPEDNNG